MKNNFSKYIFFIIVIIMVGVAVFTINNNNNYHDSNKITELRLGVVEFDTINPILSQNKNVQDISRIIFEPLFNIDEKYEIIQGLATEISKLDNNMYIITLRKDVYWHDGTIFTSSDVKFTIDKLKEIYSIYSENVRPIISLEIIDEYTIKLGLDSDIPFFEYNLTFPIMSAKYYENEDFVTSTKNINPIGTGLFKISEIKDSQIILKNHENYWNTKENEKTILNTVSINLYSNMGEAYNAFKIGNIDLITTSMLNISDYIGSIGYNIKEYKGREYDFLAINCNNQILSNTEVRKAIEYAIDKTQISQEVFNNKFYICNNILYYDSWLYTEESSSSGYNPEQSKKILLDNGWEFINNIWKKDNITLKIKLSTNASNSTRQQVAEFIKKQLETIGIIVTIESVDDTKYQAYLDNKNYEILLTGIYSSYNPNIDYFLGRNNLANYENDKLNELLKKAKNTEEKKVLKETFKEIINIYKDETPYISLYCNKNTLAYAANLYADITPNFYNIFYNIGAWYRK